MSRSRSILAAVLVLVFYALHQDSWNWTKADPLVFGFLPVGLAYHAAYTLGASVLMALLVKLVWPAHLEAARPEKPPGEASSN